MTIQPKGNAPNIFTEVEFDPSILSNLSESPGVYKLILYHSNGQVAPIPRFSCTDLEGVLYIGKTKNMKQRLRDMCDAFHNENSRHKHGSMEKFFRSRATQQTWGTDPTFRIKYLPMVGSEDQDWLEAKAIVKERCEIRQYWQRFGEVPPLNARMGDRLKD